MKILLLLLNFVFVTAQELPVYPSPRCEDDIYGFRQLYQSDCMMHDGIERCWWIPQVKSLNSATKVPLVVELHGYTGCAEWNSYTGFLNLTSTNDFILVWPQGTYNLAGARDKTSAWNVSDEGQWCFGGAAELHIDDVGFLTKLIEKLSSELPVDTSRVYMAGHSNGCAMAQMMAAKQSSIIAGVACHACYLLASPSPDYIPTSIMEIHGEIDQVVPYQGWSYCKNTSAELNAEDWKNLNNCEEKVTETFEHYHSTTYKGCNDDTEVVLISLPNVGHTPYLAPLIDNNTAPIDTTFLAWEFLRRFRKEQKTMDEVSPEASDSSDDAGSSDPFDDHSSGKPNGNIIFPGLMIICFAINQLN